MNEQLDSYVNGQYVNLKALAVVVDYVCDDIAADADRLLEWVRVEDSAYYSEAQQDCDSILRSVKLLRTVMEAAA